MGKRNGSSFEIGGLPLWGMFAAGAALLMITVFTLANLPGPRATGAQPAPVSTYTFPSNEPAQVDLPVAVIGDSFTGGSGQDSGQAARWPATLAGFDVTTYHEGGTGYAATLDTADGPSNFVTRVEQMPSDGISNLVFFGSINDGRLGYDATRAAAETALSEARSKWPDARILVIGPASPRWPVPTEFVDARNATRDAAAQEGLTFVDPIELGWFYGTQGLIGSDNTHPNDEGHAYLAERMQTVLDETFTR